MKKIILFVSMLVLAGCGTADFLGLYTGTGQVDTGQVLQNIQLQVISDNGGTLQGQVSVNGFSSSTFTGTASGDQMTVSIFNNTGALGQCSGTLTGTLTLNNTQLTGTLFCNGNTNQNFQQGNVSLFLNRISSN